MFCPFCKEEIKDDAIKCKHCGSNLTRRVASATDVEDDLDHGDTIDSFSPRMVIGDRYRVIKEIGRGGMGIVYLAQDEQLEIPVALKVLPAILVKDERSVRELKMEAKLAMSLSHHNIIRLHNFEEMDRSKFMVMEYLNGPTLDQILQTRERLNTEEVEIILSHVSQGLDYAHSQKVIHRDLKPANIMVTFNREIDEEEKTRLLTIPLTEWQDYSIKICDFGIARKMKDSMSRISKKPETSGTLLYMSPEQIQGKNLTPQSDIYSLGAVCYELLSGNPPFYTGGVEYQIVNVPAEPITGITEKINKIILKSIAKEPKGRYTTTVELARAFSDKDIMDEEYSSHGVSICSKQKLKQPFPPEFTNSIGMKFVLIKAGTFMMGSPSDEKGRDSDEGPQHRVTLTNDFYFQTTEVTQAQYEEIMGKNPSDFKYSDLPVENVTWYDAVKFCKKLLQKEGKEYRLPTEVEWEYACRAGTTTKYYFGDDEEKLGEHAWYCSNSDYQPHVVGMKGPNAWELYDMHGNVWEWCNDWYGKYPKGDATDPIGPNSGEYKVLRGGSWFNSPVKLLCAGRSWSEPDYKNDVYGFRCAMTP